MGDVISVGRQRRAPGREREKLTSITRQPCRGTGVFSLRLAQEGEQVRIVSINGGKGLHERLAVLGLRVGSRIQVLRNTMDGKLLLGHEGSRLYLGGGMAHRIQVADIKGEDE
ncbi:MAG: ferrous iron transport protein A [Deltaproteobacteria bacterium]|nr:ferrous iron transport protein A [Deltaproteobacteria bacterium]